MANQYVQVTMRADELDSCWSSGDIQWHEVRKAMIQRMSCPEILDTGNEPTSSASGTSDPLSFYSTRAELVSDLGRWDERVETKSQRPTEVGSKCPCKQAIIMLLKLWN